MVAYCEVVGCRNQKKNKSLSFFSLPREEERRKKWLDVIDRPDLSNLTDKQLRNHFVCSEHFDKKKIKYKLQLENDAIPTELLPNQPDTSKVKIEDFCEVDTQSDNDIRTFTINKSLKTSKYVQTGPEKKFHVTTQTVGLAPLESPKKRKLNDDVKELATKKRKLQTEINKIRKEIQASYNDKVGQRFARLLESSSNLNNKPRGNRFDPKFKLFALSLHYSSPQTYSCLRKSLSLPSESTLERFNMIIPSKFEDRILRFLSYKLKSIPEKAKFYTLCIDEIELTSLAHNNKTSEEKIGLHNANGEDSEELASHAYVIMLRSIVENWKLPIAYTLLTSPTHYKEIETWIDKIIEKLNGIGITIQAIVSDQSSNFDEYAKEVKKVTPEQPYFMLNDKKIYYIFDVPHLLICIRNSLLTNNFICDGKQISWKYIEDLFNKQKEDDLKLIPKVTEKHINPNNFQKMQVKCAAQVFSRSVAVAIKAYIRFRSLPKEAKHTAEFVEKMNDLFDVLNSSKAATPKRFQEAFARKQYQIDTLEDGAAMFERIEVIDKSTGENSEERLKTFKNILITIRSILMLSRDLEEKGVKFFYTRQLNQEPLEDVFGDARLHGTNLSDPTPTLFKREFSKLFISNMTQPSTFSTTQEDQVDLCELLQKAENLFKKPKPTASPAVAGTSKAADQNVTVSSIDDNNDNN